MDPIRDQQKKEALAKRRAERDERLKLRRKEDLLVVLKTASGRRFVYDILDESGLFSGSFVAGHPDISDFNEGKRDIGVKLLQDLMNAAPDAFTQMYREKASEVKQAADEDAKLTQEA